MSNTPIKDTKEKKVRVFTLAKELNLESKVLLDYCKDLGFAGITNQLNGLEPEQVDRLKDRVKKGSKPPVGPGTTPAPTRTIIPPAGKLDPKIQTLPKGRPAPARPVAPPIVAPAVIAPPVVIAQPTPVAVVAPPAPAPVIEVKPPVTLVEKPAPVVVEAPAPEMTEGIAEEVAEAKPEPTPAPVVEVEEKPQPLPVNVAPSVNSAGSAVRNLSGTRPPGAGGKPPVLGGPKPPITPLRPPGGGPAPSSNPTGTGTLRPPGPNSGTSPSVPTPVMGVPNPTNPTTAPTNPARPSVLDRRPQVPPPRQGATAPPRTSMTGGGRPSGGTAPSNQNRSGGPSNRPPGPVKSGPGQSVKLTPEMIEKLRLASARGQKMTIAEISKPSPAGTPSAAPSGRQPNPNDRATPGSTGTPARPTMPGRGPIEDVSDDGEKKGPGVIGRDARQKGRQDKGRDRSTTVNRGAVIIGADGVEVIDQQAGSRRGRMASLRRKQNRRPEKVKKEGKIEIASPINVRSLSDAIGMKAGELGKRLLKESGKLYGVNSVIELEVAQLIAAEQNIELVLKTQKTAEDILLENFEKLISDVDPDKLQPRPPIVTIMGHVDHGKTSLLDKIRSSKVAEGEVGGITQVIRAWSVVHKIDDPETGEKVIERPITFLDTPGHEAFTKMRARGANVTDIAVIVVAATDGVMPQTEEAIAHARAADVRIIVAINKVDMPNANLDKTRRQLYTLELLPDDMGGDTQFVETSAVTGQGIDDLLTAILLEAELNLADELQADPDRPATGTCLEAYMSGDEGVMATFLIQQGTLKRGDIVLCGATYGRIRAMYSDLGMPITEAGPSTPVRVTGLSDVPNADDPFYVVDELHKAQEIADVRRQKDRETLLNKFAPVSLESLTASRSKIKISELKVILKAEARGSVEAIKKELEKLVHEEVRTRVLHAGIGAITESDVQLALTSPEDTLVIGFNVTADDPALKLAESRHVQIREYQIIYNLVDDVKASLEGRLKPIEEVVHLGRAVVRETFKISKVGTIAGCYVTSGTIERNARIRVIREGVVVYPPADKVVGLDSLKRFKDDAKDVREGFECGMKLTGFDDLKNGDVIEAFKIEQRARTL